MQRFGTTIRGGAEHHALQLARLLRRRFGYDVEVLTTTATDYRHWQNGFPAGHEQGLEEGSQDGAGEAGSISVRRFRVREQRKPLLFSLYNKLMVAATRLGAPRPLRYRLEKLWYRLQGPYCPELLSYIKAEQHSYQQIIFITYLYYPTVMTARQLTVPYYLIPTLHPEPAMDFIHTRELLAGAKALIINSEAERELIKKVGDFDGKTFTVGIQLADFWWQRQSAAPAKGVDENMEQEQPYLLYVGRIDQGKNLSQLLSWFKEAKLSRPVRLLLAGPDTGTVAMPKPETTQTIETIQYMGEVTDERKVQLMAEALALIHPSTLESLGLVVLEALALGTPVILHGHNSVFRHYVAEVAYAYSFTGPDSLAEVVNQLLHEASHGSDNSARQQARDWTQAHFSESSVATKFANILQEQPERGGES